MKTKYELKEGLLKMLMTKTNRSKLQTQELYNLVDGSLEKLMELEYKLKNGFVNYCPSTKEEVEKMMINNPISTHFRFNYNSSENDNYNYNYYIYKVYDYFLEYKTSVEN